MAESRESLSQTRCILWPVGQGRGNPFSCFLSRHFQSLLASEPYCLPAQSAACAPHSQGYPWQASHPAGPGPTGLTGSAHTGLTGRSHRPQNRASGIPIRRLLPRLKVVFQGSTPRASTQGPPLHGPLPPARSSALLLALLSPLCFCQGHSPWEPPLRTEQESVS